VQCKLHEHEGSKVFEGFPAKPRRLKITFVAALLSSHLVHNFILLYMQDASAATTNNVSCPVTNSLFLWGIVT